MSDNKPNLEHTGVTFFFSEKALNRPNTARNKNTLVLGDRLTGDLVIATHASLNGAQAKSYMMQFPGSEIIETIPPEKIAERRHAIVMWGGSCYSKREVEDSPLAPYWRSAEDMRAFDNLHKGTDFLSSYDYEKNFVWLAGLYNGRMHNPNALFGNGPGMRLVPGGKL